VVLLLVRSPLEKRENIESPTEVSINYTIHCVAIPQIEVTRCGESKNSVARVYYLKKLAEGKIKKQAITCLKRRLCDIIYAMMKRRLRVYDATNLKIIQFL